MSEIWKPVVVRDVRELLLPADTAEVGLVCTLEDGREEVAYVDPSAVRHHGDLQVATGWVWDWESWDLADTLLQPYRTRAEEQEELAVDPTRYFQVGPRGGQTFVPALLAEDVERNTFLAVGVDDRLWRYVAGAYVPDGEDYTRSEATRLLAGSYRSEHVQQVVKHFYDRTSGMRLSDRPAQDVIHVLNGALEWKVGTGRAARPEDGAIVQLPVRYDPEADCPAVHKFLTEVLPEDAVDFAYELLGYMMIPGNPYRKAVLLLGSGANGKSTFLRLLVSLLGQRSCSAWDLRSLGSNRFAPADLYGKLANVCGDIGAYAPESSEVFKKITGGDPLQGEHKNHHAFVFHPFAKLVFSANEPPRTSDVTEAYFDRWLVVPFPRTFAPWEQDPRLGEKITGPVELSGLLNRSLAGLRRVQERGLVVPESVRLALGGYREAVDDVVTFAAECLEPAPGEFALQAVVYARYRAWCLQQGIDKPLRPQTFHPRVGYERSSGRRYEDVRIRGGDDPALG